VKRHSAPLCVLFALIILSLALAACGARATPTAAPVEPAGTALKLIGPNGGHALTMADLKALPVTEGMGGMKSSTGKITLPEKYTGVSLKDLINLLDIKFDDNMGVTLTAEDGYSMSFSYDQVMNGNFVAYDPAVGNELSQHDPLTAIIAYAKNDQPLDANEEGALRLAVISEKNNEVVDGHWTVKWVSQMEVKSLGQDWTFHMHGAISQPVDRATFQSCGSPSCHGTSWTDENGQSWVGVPLWYFVGEVDDSNSHEANAFNTALADTGYTVTFSSMDGQKTITLDSSLIKRNNDVMLAYLVNDAELPEQYYPLRLVGTGLQPEQMIGQVEMMQLNLPESAIPTAAPTQAVVEGTVLITGMVEQELSLAEADLRALEVVHITAEHPKKGMQEYDGVRLNALLAKAGLKAGASTVVFTASDGYVTEISLADIQACADCLLAFTDTPGSYSTVMPGMLGNNWSKNVIKIEIK
jgi:DMSO/TMAO reductase YedYZ molybdopterin-dependent catalytic subunit